MTKFSPFDAADYLDDKETIAEYLTAALEDSNPERIPNCRAGCGRDSWSDHGGQYTYFLRTGIRPSQI